MSGWRHMRQLPQSLVVTTAPFSSRMKARQLGHLPGCGRACSHTTSRHLWQNAVVDSARPARAVQVGTGRHRYVSRWLQGCAETPTRSPGRWPRGCAPTLHPWHCRLKRANVRGNPPQHGMIARSSTSSQQTAHCQSEGEVAVPAAAAAVPAGAVAVRRATKSPFSRHRATSPAQPAQSSALRQHCWCSSNTP